MPEQIIAVIYPVFLIALSIFLVYRLKMRQTRDVEGLGLIYTGLFLILISSLANLLQHQPDYPTWFIGDVYTVIPIAEFLLLAGGVILFLIGLVLYFSYWGDRDQEVANHLEKLRLLDNLQQENRYPSPVPELLDRVLRGMLSGLDEEAGAIFLLNRSQKKFVLVTASGLTKEEISLLEYYPYGRNIVTQTVEDETPMISSDFRSLGGKAQLAASKFRSILVVPLISGRSRVGALLFFSQEEMHYSREFISRWESGYPRKSKPIG
jgi:hypothetical protein